MNRALARGRIVTIWEDTEADVCMNCEHFMQHYLSDGCMVTYGHCVYPRCKVRKIYDTCKYFERRDETWTKG